jgi:hypothetical protein
MGWGFAGNRRARVNSGSDLAHEWAHRQKTGGKAAASMFYERDVIYSYGYHFPMARLWQENYVFVTKETRSNTTTRHQGYVNRAISHKEIIHVWDVPTKEDPRTSVWCHEKNFKSWEREIQDVIEELATGKKSKVAERIGRIESITAEAQRYATILEIEIPEWFKQYIGNERYIDGLKEKYKKEIKEAIAKEKSDKENAAKMFHDNLQAWKVGVPASELPHDSTIHMKNFERENNLTYLRVMGDVIETSKSIRVPIPVAHRYYRKYLAVVAAGGCNDNCNYKMLDFPVMAMTEEILEVGCHRIQRAEINDIAKQLNWNHEPENSQQDSEAA